MLMHLCGEDLNSNVIELRGGKNWYCWYGIGKFYLKTWHLIVTEAPVQMPLL